jgi:hypothetical protein
MIDTGAGLRVRHRVLLVLLVCLALPLVGGCSSDPECLVVFFLPQCFDDDDDEEEKTDDTATQTSVRVNAHADAIDPTMVALRRTLAGMDVATQAVVNRHLDEISLSLELLREEVVHRDAGFHRRVDGLNRAIRSSLEAIRAEVGRLDADMRNTVAGHLDDIDAITLLNDERMRTDCRLVSAHGVEGTARDSCGVIQFRSGLSPVNRYDTASTSSGNVGRLRMRQV